MLPLKIAGFCAALVPMVVAGCQPQPAAAPAPPEPAPAPSEVGSAQQQTVSITLADFRFTPDKVLLRRGKTYRLHLTNASSTAHSFQSATFFRAVTLQPPLPLGMTDGTEIELAPGEQKTVLFIAKTPGVYPFECGHFLHATLGMTGQITIR